MGNGEKKKRGCLKLGCLGCLVLLAVPVGLAALIGFTAWTASRRPASFEDVQRTRELPRAPGKIVLEITMCDFEIVPAAAGDPLRVEGRFDKSAYDLEETWEGDPETGWTYRLTFDRRGPRLWLKSGDEDNRLRLVLPRDVPFSLAGSLGTGRSKLELGGLAITSADLTVGMGEHEIRFEEPLPEPMQRFHLDGSIGELRVTSLGNASPELSEIEHTLGEVSVDLMGSWQRDARIAIRCGVGRCRVVSPDGADANTVLDAISVSLGNRSAPETAPARADLPTLHLAISARMGDVELVP